MKHRRFLLLTLLLFILASVIYAQGMATPVPGVKPDMSWSELAAMVAVLGTLSGVFHWIIARAIIRPQIEESVKLATKEIMAACLDQFTSKYAFMVHEKEEALKQEAVSESMQEIVKSQDEDNRRLTDVRERVRVLEAYRRTS